MSSLPYKSFAILGAAGSIGRYIFDALHERNASILAITCSSSLSTDALPNDVKVAKVDDYKNVEAVAAVLRANRIEVVICAFTWQSVEAIYVEETVLADAARAAGVKLFVPSEYGLSTEGAPEGLWETKDNVAEYMIGIELPAARFFTGIFFSWISGLSGYPSTGKINVLGTGRTLASWTATEDVGSFIAHVLTTLPPAELNDGIFRIEGERLSWEDVATRMGAPITSVEKVPADSESLTRLCAVLQRMVEEGSGSTGWDSAAKEEGTERARSANSLWSGHVWKKVPCDILATTV
ncbi:NAD(P)-binding protein [Armillaria solidipes]|uniref:NAD(P)-binding protein n=1 Tax=Armillaria solidipes TaxID=1076256 RepID=A0A2H3BR69_9AGAR|nr:NAD(P)-binding protein [Armillaria solidipes]